MKFVKIKSTNRTFSGVTGCRYHNLPKIPSNGKAPAYMFLARNIYNLIKSPEQKRIILAPTILIDTIYQDIQEYQKKVSTSSKRKASSKKNTCNLQSIPQESISTCTASTRPYP